MKENNQLITAQQKEPELIEPIQFFDPEDERFKFVPVDEWEMKPEDQLFTTVKGAILLPVYDIMKVTDPKINKTNLNAFIMTPKRSYNNPKMRTHIVQYMNYFEKYYDPEHELASIYAKIKYLIDIHPQYNDEALFSDICKYFMHGPLSVKLSYMNRDNYNLHLTYKNKKNPALQYSDVHGMMLMKISLIMNATIPLLCHFMYARNVDNTINFLYSIYDRILHMYDVDIYNKLYETAISNVSRSGKRDKQIWDMQDIRGINQTTHALQCVYNIILNIMPKYVYSENLIHYNYKSIQKSTGFQVTDIEFEFSFVSLSSSKRDEDKLLSPILVIVCGITSLIAGKS